jgi:outer membrane PBP1 activator LpoA protein
MKTRNPFGNTLCATAAGPRALRLLAVAVAVLTLAGCPQVQRPSPEEEAAHRAEALAAAGEGLRAARELARLGEVSAPPARYGYRLRAAELYLEADALVEAERNAAPLGEDVLSPAQRVRLRAVRSDLALRRDDPATAARLLEGLPRADTPAAMARRLWELRARALAALGRPVEAVQARIALGELLARTAPGDSAAQGANRDALWAQLLAVPARTLEPLRGRPVPLGGWAELAVLFRGTTGEVADLTARLAAWRAAHPDHPAAGPWLEGLLEQARGLRLSAARVALILPTEGNLSPVGSAVRDGFLAAYFDARGERPEVLLYALGDDPGAITEAYARALGDGAQVVVGPLRKEAVQALTATPTDPGADDPAAGTPDTGTRDLPVPTLALNYLPGDLEAPANLYQFGLSPEDEARQAAQRAWLDGHSRALVLAPLGDWGERVAGAFAARWQWLGGQVLETAHYDRAERDPFSEPVQRLLNLDASEARRDRLTRLLGRRLAFEPRRRQDADFVFIVGFSAQAQRIVPQLAFQGAADLPVYTTSHAFDGDPQGPVSRDLEGLRFGDMPWVLAPDGDSAALKAALARSRPGSFATYRRMYALGVDAFRLIPHLPRLARFSVARVNGVTGSLRMDPQRRLHRELVWARISDGQAVQLENDVFSGP